MTVETIRGENLHLGIGAANLSSFTSGYRNNKTVWVLPTRGSIPIKVHVALRNMAWLMNTPRICIDIAKMEVAAAYEEAFGQAVNDPQAKSFPWIWTYEEDNIQPQDVFFKLFEAMWKCFDCGATMPSGPDGGPADPWVCPSGHRGLDAVGGLYFTKSLPPFPMAYGNPKSPELEFRPLDVREAVAEGRVIEVNGVAMGSTLWRKGLFEKISRPWFKTLSGGEPDHAGAHTQDLYACRKAKEEAGARFAVHCGVAVGHLDIESGRVF